MGRYVLTNSCLANQVADWVPAAAGTPQLSRIYTVMTHARPAALPAVHVTYRRSCLTHIDVHEIGGKRSAENRTCVLDQASFAFAAHRPTMTLWQRAMMAGYTEQRVQSDLQAQLEASHAEVAHMQKQIAATTAALHSARASDTAHVSYPAPGDPDYSEDSLIRSVCKADVKGLLRKVPKSAGNT